MSEKSGNWFKQRQARKTAAGRLYDGLMKAALHPRYYESGDVADTFDGRAQMVTLHATVLAGRLNSLKEDDAKKLVDVVNTRVLDGFHDAFREDAVGDSSIARRMRKLAEAHYGLAKALMTALSEPDRRAREQAVAAVLLKNGVLSSDRVSELPGYICAQADRFAAQPSDDMLTGDGIWIALE